ncbi:MAG: DUF2283 domain-containing protein [Candidatus Daviesbacteria bacterium]|nr:DUF2283 domain-containing protein [Candidatus Daviesbacteria bacterium]
MKKTKNFKLEYDKEGDILYLSKGALTKEDTSEELEDDVVIWRNKKTSEVSGFTVLNFSKRTSKKSSNINLPFEVELHPTI